MQDWNVIITVRKGGFKKALSFFKPYGLVSKTGFYNVLVLRSSNVDRMMAELREEAAENPFVLGWLSRVLPVNQVVNFQTAEEFETKVREAISAWMPELAGKSFHVRMVRRGMKGELSSWEMEKRLNEFLLHELEKLGTPGRIAFHNPQALIAVETLGPVAGLSFWREEELRDYPFLGSEARAGSKESPERAASGTVDLGP